MYIEQELVQACIKQDRTAQRRLYELFAGKFFVTAMRYVKNKADAEDILQDSFIKIYDKIGQFRFDCPLEAWLRKIVVNTALMHLRNQPNWQNHIESDAIADEVAGQDFVLAGFQFQELMEMIQSLPGGCRAVFNLYAIEGYQHNEISEMLGIAEGTSKSQLMRAKALLRAKILNESRNVGIDNPQTNI